MGSTFGETIREMRQAQQLGLRTAADRLGISPAYLSRIERGKERPPKPDLVKRLTTLLGGDPDRLFRLAESTDPDLADYMHSIPNVPEFLRTAKAMKLTSEDFATLIEEMKQRGPSDTVPLQPVRAAAAGRRAPRQRAAAKPARGGDDHVE